VVLALLLVTKAADCVTTLVRVGSPHEETNPRARRLMQRWGIGRTVVAYGLLAGLIAVASALPALLDEAPWYAAGYVALGLPVAAVQADVAWSNWRGKLGPLAKVVAKAQGRAESASHASKL
jgi:hypothetical protein